MPLAEITGAISAVKSAVEIIKYIKSTSKDIAVNEKAIELQNIILSIQSSMLELQSEYYELLESKDSLEKKLINMEDWKITESQYDLVEVRAGVFIYFPNKNHPNPKPDHYLCTKCFNDRKKSLLQKKGWGDITHYFCPSCGMEILFNAQLIKS